MAAIPPVPANGVPQTLDAGGCQLASQPWTFNVGNTTVTTTNGTGTLAVTQGATLAVSEVQQAGFDFGALRCYTDHMPNGGSDNLDFLWLPSGLTSGVYCVAYNVQPTYKVHITKYLDGSQVSSGTWYMSATWTKAQGVADGSGIYTIDSNGWGGSAPFQAQTAPMLPTATYTTHEVLNGSGDAMPTTCTGTNTTRLLGYTTGTLGFDTNSGAISSTAPNFGDLESDEYVTVWNQTCETQTLFRSADGHQDGRRHGPQG